MGHVGSCPDNAAQMRQHEVLSSQPVRYRGPGARGRDPACCYDFDNTRRRHTSAGRCRAGRARYIASIRGRIIDEPSASRKHSEYFRIGIRCRSNKGPPEIDGSELAAAPSKRAISRRQFPASIGGFAAIKRSSGWAHRSAFAAVLTS